METVTFQKSEVFKEKAERLFSEQRTKIIALMPNVDIQHIGSTAIPGLLTKGDLDINVRVNAEDFDAVVEILKGMYEINQPHNWTQTYASFKDDHSFTIPFGVQVSVRDSPDDYFVKHRDMLLHNPKLVEKLNELKITFEGKDMDAYRAAKGEFIESNVSL